MNIYEYWSKRQRGEAIVREIMLPIMFGGRATGAALSEETLRDYHTHADLNRFSNYVLNNRINPAALGYTPISR